MLLFFAVIIHSITGLGQDKKLSNGDSITYHEKYRPQYHLTSPDGALFDPTDLVYYNGLYHVNKGLATSRDLVRWKIGTRQSFSTDSVREMSGSLVIDSTNSSGFGKSGQIPLVAIFSGLRQKTHEQIQCIAYSLDKGDHWSLYDKNPVIDIHSTEFRDPQVFWYERNRKWIMVVALAAERKIRFYQSGNLKDWKSLSDFGPFGAINGVWECPDFFQLPVSKSHDRFKWVLEVSVQPVGGQYFIGDFDGTRFIPDQNFKQVSNLNKIEGDVIFDFENNLTGWTKSGDAFDLSPANGALSGQNAILGYLGKKLINSFNGGDQATGILTSPRFRITKKYLNFLIGGGLYDQGECVNLLINGKKVRSATGSDAEVLSWSNWNVSNLIGNYAQLQIIDKEKGPFGHILFDELVASNIPSVNKRETAHWLDYGPDFYAVRSWVNSPDDDDRRVSVAWLGNWQYAFKVPSTPWKGGHTFPRSVQIMGNENSFRLSQNPVEELAKLRISHTSQSKHILGTRSWSPGKINQNSYEFLADFVFLKKSALKITLCSGWQSGTVISYNPATETLKIDRSKSGVTDFSPAFPETYSAPLKLRNHHLKLHILVDRSSLELFANDGEINMTCQIFPGPEDTGISVRAINGTIKMTKLDLWNLKSIWTSN